MSKSILFYSARPYEMKAFDQANKGGFQLKYLHSRLTVDTATLANGFPIVSLFVNDVGNAEVLEMLYKGGVRLVALRSAGFNHIDLDRAKSLGMLVVNVPEYSPYSIAEHTIALMLALNRKLIRANSRVRDLNFTLDGLTGFDLHGKTVGIIGTGKIGAIVAKILHGFGCQLLGYDLNPDAALVEQTGIIYTGLTELCQRAKVITLHLPLYPQTKYLINAERIAEMPKGVMLINTSRGGLVNTKEVIAALKTGHIGYLGLDVYEEEQGLFFEDHSDDILQDDLIARLLTFKNVLITSHQAFLTHEALQNIADTTMQNVSCWTAGKEITNLISI